MTGESKKTTWHLLSKDHISTGVGVHLRYNKLSHEFTMHDHEFHELVLIVKGNANHYVNGEVYPMSGGLLMFVRDSDLHTFTDFTSKDFEYYTLALEHEVTDGLFCFLGKGFDPSPLFSAKLPPKVCLSAKDAEAMGNMFAKIFMLMNGNPEELLTETRIMLVDVFSRYFRTVSENIAEVPLWLENAYLKMQSPKNFSAGTERFFMLCGKSREHAAREFSKHYGMPPIRFVTGLRMSYAANLLSSSNLAVSEIAYLCGYGSVSNFYNGFVKEFGVTPSRFRKGVSMSLESE